METTKRETPNWIFVSSVIFIGWNLTGVVFYLNEMFMGPEMFDSMSSAQQDFFTSRPAWVTSSYAIAVWVGTIASFLLLLRKKWAFHAFVISLAGALLQITYNLFIGDGIDAFGPSALIVPSLVTIIGFVEVWATKKATDEGWLS
jgi:hypothetical protein